MVYLRCAAALSLAGSLAAQESPARRLLPTAIPLSRTLATISGVHELRDGRLVISDGKGAGLYLLDPAARSMTPLGAVGGDSLQYAQPGGLYASAGDSAWLLDRGLAKVLLVSPTGAILRSRSIKENGITYSSDADVDRQRIDGRGLAYFTTHGRMTMARRGSAVVDSVLLVRFDAARQHYDTVARLREPEARVVQATENMQMTQAVIGSPADGWGVAPSGRVAVVRADPYHVEWIDATGHVARGPVYGVPAIAFTQAEKDSIAKSSGRGGVAVGMGGASSTSTSTPMNFADAKAPFSPPNIVVSPDGHVWVGRSGPADAAAATYDVFDEKGERVDRVAIPDNARIIGFGRGVVYAMLRGGKGAIALVKYKL
jgi:sugar lactone lactonase YvrE